MQSHRRAFLSLRRQFLSSLNSNPPFSRSLSSLNPNSPSSSFSTSISRHDHCLVVLKSLVSINSHPLKPNSSSRSTFIGVRGFATRLAESSNNRPPKETIMLAGCDWEHWLVVVNAPDGNLTRDEIIDGYIKTLAQIVGSEDEARMKIYSVSTRHYYAFGVLLPEEVACKLKDLPHVRWVLPDSYLDVKNKTYAGEPFINGQAVPYDPKYHEIWVRNHEASLRNNGKNKRRQRDPNTSSPRSRSPSSVSSRPTSANENWIPSACSENQPLQMSNVQSQKSGQPSLSISSVPPRNQAPQTSQIQDSAPLGSRQSQASQYSQIQNQSSLWTNPPPGPSTTMGSNQMSRGNQYQSQRPVVGSNNQARHPSQMQNPTSQASFQSQAPPYSQMQTHSSPWSQPNCRGGSDQNQNWTPLSQNHGGDPSQMQNPVAPSQPSPTVDPNYLSGGEQKPFPGSQNQAGHHQSQAFSQSHTPEYTQIGNYQRWRSQNDNWTAVVGSQSQDGHPSQIRNSASPVYSQSQVPQYSQMQNWNCAGGSGNHKRHHSSQWQNQIHPSSPNMYTSEAWSSASASASQSWESASGYQNQSLQSSVPRQDLSYGNVPPPSASSAMPSNMQSSVFRRGGSFQSQAHQQNGYLYRDNSYGAQSSGSQNGYQCQTQQYMNTFQDQQSLNRKASPHGWNYQNVTPHLQNDSFQNGNMRPQAQNNHSIQNDNFHCPAGLVDQQVGNSCNREPVPSYNNTGNMYTRDYQERDNPMDEEYIYASK